MCEKPLHIQYFNDSIFFFFLIVQSRVNLSEIYFVLFFFLVHSKIFNVFVLFFNVLIFNDL